MIKCEVCGGSLKMQANHEAICESCGLAYSIESLRAMMGSSASPRTESSDDLSQMRILLDKYLSAFDYEASESIAKKILEISPTDTEANRVYKQLQSWKYFDIRNGKLIKYNGSEENVEIPEGISGINPSAFKDYRMVPESKNLGTIRHIIIPDGIQIIPDALFMHMDSLVSVELPQSITTIGEYAFNGCKSLKNILLPNKLESIGACAFEDCTSLESIQFPDSLTQIGYRAFAKCELLSSLILPSGITELSNAVFSGTGIEHIVIPENIKKIGTQCFAGCKKLKLVSLKEDTGRKEFAISSKVNNIDCTDAFDGSSLIGDGIRMVSSSRTGQFESIHYRKYGTYDNPDEAGEIKIYNEKAIEWEKRGLCLFCGGEIVTKTDSYKEGRFRTRHYSYRGCSSCGWRGGIVV